MSNNKKNRNKSDANLNDVKVKLQFATRVSEALVVNQ